MKLHDLTEESNRPYLFRNAAKDWEATSTWSLEYFLQHYGEETIHVIETLHRTLVGTDKERKSYKPLMFKEFLNKAINQEMAPESYLYMLQSDLLDRHEHLQTHYSFPDIYRDHSMVDYLWISPNVAQTPLHCDSEYILSFQAWGTKRWTFYSPYKGGEFYRVKDDEKLKHISMVDIDAVDRELYPDFPQTFDFQMDVHAGDILYVPPGWWHHVVSSTACITVTRCWEREKLNEAENS